MYMSVDGCVCVWGGCMCGCICGCLCRCVYGKGLWACVDCISVSGYMYVGVHCGGMYSMLYIGVLGHVCMCGCMCGCASIRYV